MFSSFQGAGCRSLDLDDVPGAGKWSQGGTFLRALEHGWFCREVRGSSGEEKVRTEAE